MNIRIDGGTQFREKINQDVVTDYKERLKEGLSQVRDWLHSSNWTYKEFTILDQSGYDIAAGGRGFMGVATIPFSVDIKPG
jgi:hypothetical protein